VWDKIQIEILIQVTPESSGSLIRLLRSLAAADYSSSTVPHITIELPHRIDTSTKTFLDSFEWPPRHFHEPTGPRTVSLRHRMPRRRLTEDESLARFLESFWPAQPHQSHVLVLSPHVQFAPQFFHCTSSFAPHAMEFCHANSLWTDLKYMLLEYCYSTAADSHHWGRRLFGISLEQPSITLDGKPFSPPLFQHPDDVHGEKGTPNPFLWQAPTSNAVLILGDKWMELHDFASRTTQATEQLDAAPTIVSEKSISRQYPSWLEHALRLARVRGYWFVYPGDEVAEHLGTVHTELYTVPEEYAARRPHKGLISDDAGDFTVGDIREKVRSGAELQVNPLSLLESLPNNGKLWPLAALPIAAWDGGEVSFQDLRTRAGDFELAFKNGVGGCEVEGEKGQKPLEPMVAQDLFCNVP
jgi:hypothetical protein